LRAPFHIFPLGDAAITIDLGNCIQEPLNRKVLAMHKWLQDHPFEGLTDSLVGYSSVTVYYNPFAVRKYYKPPTTVYDWVAEQLRQAFELTDQLLPVKRNSIRIPVCYESPFAPDLDNLAQQRQLTMDEVIQIHTASIYNVYMIGFLPGFSYMGLVNEQITFPRKPTPVPVAAGSVGIAGSQTGIYPLNSPGGWQIIGRTPIRLFDPKAPDPVTFHAGDQVQFYSITSKEYHSMARGK
jgi:inhibitor of KinA